MKKSLLFLFVTFAFGTAKADFAPCPSNIPENMACIPGGSFVRGSDKGAANARPAATVTVSTFLMDKYEVTYGEYQACVKAKKCEPARPLYADFNDPKQPMTALSWYNAKQYCEVHNKRLPTEAEWEKAARGPDGATFPWGNDAITCKRAIIMDETGRSCGRTKRGGQPEKGKPWPVGSRDPGVYGLYDMAGNVDEWVADWYSKDWDACGEACLGIDPKGPCNGADKCKGHRTKSVRGGSWYWPGEHSTGYFRRSHIPSNNPAHHFGFRCAADVPAPAPVPVP